MQNWLKWAFLGVLGEFCTGWAAGGGVLGEFCTGFGARWGTKFSLLGQNGLKWAILGVLEEFCTGWAAGVGVLGEFCTGCVDVRSRLGDLPAAKG